MNGSCLLILLILCAMNRCCGETSCESSNSGSGGCGNQSVIQPRRERQESFQREQDSCGCENSRDERNSSDCGCRKDPEPCFEQVRTFVPYPNANSNSNSSCGCGKN